jgi:hypothetical protein
VKGTVISISNFYPEYGDNRLLRNTDNTGNNVVKGPVISILNFYPEYKASRFFQNTDQFP